MSPRRRGVATVATIAAGLLCPVAAGGQGAGRPGSAPGAGWPTYGGDPGGSRYSPLGTIHRGNVTALELAWSYRTGELGQGARDGADLTFEATPILFEGVLYLSTGFGKVIALDPATGTERWTHDPDVPRDRAYSEVTSRGVAAWRDPEAPERSPCASRILLGTIDARLIALDAATGAPCAGFGEDGEVDLAREVGMEGNGDYQVTSPPAVVDGVVVVGSSIGDNWSADTGSGVVRGFDARTGEVRWRWHPIPREESPGRVGAANAWSAFSADPDRGLVFVPTGSPSPDFYGGMRPGEDRWANSVVALRGETGELVWGFQTVHHDLWDYDVASQPVLVTVERESGPVPAVAVPTKVGSLFLLHRETGEPLFPVEERPVPRSDVPGEESWPTQPFPTRPRPLVPQGPLGPSGLAALPPEDRAECLAAIQGARSEGPFTPPSLEGSVLYPGNAGGTNWGSAAWDRDRGRLVLNTLRLATFVQLIPREELGRARREAGEGWEFGAQRGAPYGIRRRSLLSARGVPCNPPPWGTLAAVDLATGEVAWEVPFGATGGDPSLGHLNMGGPIVTAGGLVFVGASLDGRFRAFDAEGGEELWNVELPRAAIATPMTYEAAGRQFVAVAAGGHGKAGLELGDWVLAFALPEGDPGGR